MHSSSALPKTTNFYPNEETSPTNQQPLSNYPLTDYLTHFTLSSSSSSSFLNNNNNSNHSSNPSSPYPHPHPSNIPFLSNSTWDNFGLPPNSDLNYQHLNNSSNHSMSSFPPLNFTDPFPSQPSTTTTSSSISLSTPQLTQEQEAFTKALQRLEAKRAHRPTPSPTNSCLTNYSSHPSSTSSLKPMTLEEVEAQLLSQMGKSTPSNISTTSSIQPSPTPSSFSSFYDSSTSLTLEELENSILNQQQQQQYQQNSLHPPMISSYYSLPSHPIDPNDTAQLIEIRKSARETNMRRLARYNGLMSRYERDQVTRIHISQLVTDNPMKDDFYYQIYTTIRGGASTLEATRFKPPLLQRGVRNTSLQQQIERILESSKQKPKATQFSLEGALGKIALTSSKKPRQSLQLTSSSSSSSSSSSNSSTAPSPSPSSSLSTSPVPLSSYSSIASSLSSSFTPPPPPSLISSSSSPSSSISSSTLSSKPATSVHSTLPSKLSKYSILLATETLFSLAIDLEQRKREYANVSDFQELEIKKARSSFDPSHLEERTVSAPSLQTIMQSMRLRDCIKDSSEQLWSLLNQPCGEIPMSIAILSCNKGKKLWPRLFRLLDSYQVFSLVLSLFSNLRHLDVIKQASIPALYASPSLFPGADTSKPSFKELIQFVENTETFMTFVLPALVEMLAQADWSLLAQCWQCILQSNDVIYLGSSRVGLSLFTLLISRSELVHPSLLTTSTNDTSNLTHAIGTTSTTTNLTNAWHTSVFPKLFQTLQSHCLTLFPLTHFPLPSSAPSFLWTTLTMTLTELELYLTDDTYVWQFLASLVLAASSEQQQRLVMEIKERILGNIAAGRVSSPDSKAQRRFANVNLFLRALGLDASAIF